MKPRVVAVLALLTLCAASAVAQSSDPRPLFRPWLGASVGLGNLRVNQQGHGGAAADLLAGVEIASGLRFGVRWAVFSGISLGDQPAWSSSSTLYVAGYKPPRWPVAFTAGVGRLRWDQSESNYAGKASVLEMGVEFSVPPRHGVALRGFGSVQRPLSRPTLTTTMALPPPRINGQLQIGFGFVVH